MTDNEFKPARKIVLLGKTGDGKSSSGNTILCGERFTTESSPESITSECKSGEATVAGRGVTVIDTPGIFDTRLDEEVIKSEIIKATIECAPAVDALVIVLKVERYTRQEIEILNKVTEYCGEETFKHAVVLFTHGEQLEDQTIEEFVHKSPKLEELVNKCEGRFHVIDNRYWNDCDSGDKSNSVQVTNLLETIDKMVMESGCYTNELMLEIEDEIQDEMNLLTIDLSNEEKQEIAKKKVLKKCLIRFVGVATGTLVGAFLGVGVALFSVVALLKAAKLKEVLKAIGTAVTAAGMGAEKAAVAAVAGGTAAVGTATVSGAAAAVQAGVAAAAGGATAAGGAVAVEAGVAAGATAGAVAVEAGAGIGAAAGSGIAAGVIFGAAALAGAIGGGVTGYKAADEADSVLDAIKIAAKANYENAKEVVKKAEEIPSNIYKKFQ